MPTLSGLSGSGRPSSADDLPGSPASGLPTKQVSSGQRLNFEQIVSTSLAHHQKAPRISALFRWHFAPRNSQLERGFFYRLGIAELGKQPAIHFGRCHFEETMDVKKNQARVD
jgi:hypothetical protein